MANEDYLRVGLVGLGSVCEAVHYPGFSRIPDVEVVAICDADENLLKKRSNDWGVSRVYTDYGQFLAESEIGAVAVATPNFLHRDQVFEACERGCHVICEKPLSTTIDEAVAMLQLASDSGLCHMVALTYRWVPGMRFLKKLVRDGALGEVRHARFQRLQDWGDQSIGWRQYRKQAGYGELGDMGIHRIDFAEDLLGPINAVCGSTKQVIARDHEADGSPCPSQDLEDWVAWIAEFECGTTGVFEMGKLSKGRGAGGDHDIAEINGSEASAVYQLHTPHQVLFAPRGEPYRLRPVPDELLKLPGSPRDPSEGDPHWTFRYDQAWEFVCAIREGRSCEPSFWHGVRAQRVADAIAEAVISRRWINITPGIG